jgi:hypothetical protein
LPIQPRWCAHEMELPPELNLQLERDAKGNLTLRLANA